MSPIRYTKKYWHDATQSLRIRNFRLYFIGQGVSLCGTWMQTVAQGWLVLQLSHSGTELGFVVALQFLPLLLVTPFGGMLADRHDKRTILFITQSILALLPMALGILVISGHIELWMVYVFALLLGLANSIDNPTRQTFVPEMVGKEHLRNAVTLNSTAANLARAVGPMIGGVLIATVGVGFCFIFNAVSSLAILSTLFLMKRSELSIAPAARGSRLRQLKEGWHFVRKTPIVRNTLFVVLLIGTFAFEFAVSLPLLAQAFGSSAADYSALWIAMGLGSVLGGVYAAGRSKIAPHHLMLFSLLFGASLIAAALMPTESLSISMLFLVGFFSLNVTALANTSLQLETPPEMRGRVMSLWTMALLGSTPIGGPIIGYVGEHLGPRFGLLVGGVAAIAAGLFALYALMGKDSLRAISAAVKLRALRAQSEEESKFR